MTRIQLTQRTKRWIAGVLLLITLAAVSGCKTLGFYAQAIRGQYQLFAHDTPIEKLLQDQQVPENLKARLTLLLGLRSYAETQLKLPVDGHYKKYVDVHRPYVVWNVQAAPEFSMQPKTWWYPLVGSLEYRGYFFHDKATNYAGYLRGKGYDVAVGGVEAYSTLGWFKDPALNTFIFEPDPDLAEIIFHELGHQRVFARGDTDFNEAFATAVGQEGAQRWLKARGDQAGLTNYLAYLQRNSEFVHLVMKTRARLETLFGDTHNEEGKVRSTDKNRDVPTSGLRTKKQQVYADFRKDLYALKAKWGGRSGYDSWFEHSINNAHLNSIAEYFDLVPGFQELLALNGNDLEKFYEAAERLAKKPKKERQEFLRTLARPH